MWIFMDYTLLYLSLYILYGHIKHSKHTEHKHTQGIHQRHPDKNRNANTPKLFLLDCQTKCKTWVQLGRFRCVCAWVCMCTCVDGSYFICIASSWGNNFDFFQFSFWNESSCECFINGAMCTVRGACGMVYVCACVCVCRGPSGPDSFFSGV